MTATGPVSNGPIEDLLTGLRRGVPGHRTGRGRELIREISDGLHDAATEYREAGLSTTDAEQRAVDDFGDVAAAAALCREQIGVASGIRSAVLVAIAFPAMLACWGLYFALFDGARRTVDAQLLRSAHVDHRMLDAAAGVLGDPETAGVIIGNGFTIIGLTAAGLALVAARRLQLRSRGGSGETRPVVLAFAVTTLASVLLTYLLAAVTGGPFDTGATAALAERVAQWISSLLAVLVTWAACSALRHNLTSPMAAEGHHRSAA